MFNIHNYEPLTESNRPQDPTLDGAGLTFKTMEHGGEYPDTMPQAILLTDAEGRTCTYVPIEVNGKAVNSKGFFTNTRPSAKFDFNCIEGCAQVING